jgi:2-methylcitrate dehydratase PrpD
MSDPAAGLTAALVRRAAALRFEDLPPAIVRLAGQCLLDWLGVTIAGSVEPASVLLRAEVLPEAAPGPATVLGTGERVGPATAALLNGTAAHALDYDDVVPAMSGHPSAPVLAALLAVAEESGLDGRRFVTAFVAGFETECRLGRLLAPGHYGSGWHATGTLGTLGAAAASAHALGLDEERWRHALGLAATQAAGLRAVFGTMAKPLHAGNAAAHGQRAARLAAAGFTGGTAVVEARYGLADTMSTTVGDAEQAFAVDYDLANVLFKHHAACYGAHAAIDATRVAIQGLRAEQVERVVVRAPSSVVAQCGRRSPQTELEAKFSIPFALALVLTGTTTGRDGFTPAALADPRLRDLAARVELVADDDLPVFAAVVGAETTAGRREAEVDVSIPVPLSDLAGQQHRLEAKFAELAVPTIGEDRARRLVDLTGVIAEVPDVGEALAPMVRQPRQARISSGA